MDKGNKGNGHGYSVNAILPTPGLTFIPDAGCYARAAPAGDTALERVTAQWWISNLQHGEEEELSEAPIEGELHEYLDGAPYGEHPDFVEFEVRFVAHFQGGHRVPQTVAGVRGYQFPTLRRIRAAKKRKKKPAASSRVRSRKKPAKKSRKAKRRVKTR